MTFDSFNRTFSLGFSRALQQDKTLVAAINDELVYVGEENDGELYRLFLGRAARGVER